MKKILTLYIKYDIVDGRMEELRSFFYAQKTKTKDDNDYLSGGGSRAR